MTGIAELQFVPFNDEMAAAPGEPTLSKIDSPLNEIFRLAQERFNPVDLEAGGRDQLLRDSIKKLNGKGKLDLQNLDGSAKKVVKAAEKLAEKSESDDEEDESIDQKNLPAGWKRHTIVIGFGAAAAYFSTIPSQALTSLFFTLGFLKLSKSYMVGFPRMRRYIVLASIVGAAVGLKTVWNDVNLMPLAAGLGVDGLSFTAKAYMKGKMKKDEGPAETNPLLLRLQNGVSSCCSGISSCLDSTVSKVSSCLSSLCRKANS